MIITTAYSSVLDIYLDYNEISSIEVLESDGWLDRFRAFSLRGNDLNKVFFGGFLWQTPYFQQNHRLRPIMPLLSLTVKLMDFFVALSHIHTLHILVQFIRTRSHPHIVYYFFG